MNNIKSKEPPTAPATDNSEFTKLTPEQRKKFLSYDFKIDKDFLTNIANNITGIVDLKILDVLFLKNTYGDFKEIKSRYYQKNENGKLYLEQIINQYIETKKKHNLDILIPFIIQQKEITLINEDYQLFTEINNKYFLPLNNFYDTLKQLLYFYNVECEVERNIKPTHQHQQVKPLAGKINWINKPELLRTHLETLKNNNFIQYDNIDSVMSGDEIAIFIKHKTYTAPCNNILALYDLWNEKKYISDYADREGKRQYKEFMENVFNWEENGKIKPVNHKSMKSIYSERIKKITEVKKHFESVL